MICFALIACVIVLYFIRYFTDRRNTSSPRIPVVSPRLPIFGNAWQIDLQRTHQCLAHLASKYGPIYEIKMFLENIVVLNNHSYIHEALVTNGSAIAGRPNMQRTAHANRNKNSLVWQTYTPNLIFLRKEIAKYMRPYGTGSNKLEEKCLPEIKDMLLKMEAKNGGPFYPREIIYDAVCSVMLILLLGDRPEHGCESFQRIRDISKRFNKTFGSGQGLRVDFLPIAWFRKQTEYEELETSLRMRDEFWAEVVGNRPLPDESIIGRMQLQGKTLKSEGEPEKQISNETIKECFTNLLLAGTDTTATAIECLILILIHNPDIQQRMHTEIDDVIGCSTNPGLEHKCSMPYTNAVLLELLRYISHIPLALPHCTIEDTKIANYIIPKGTTIFINLWASHHDPDFWHDPWKFNPDRFLDQNGHLLSIQHQVRKRLMPFGGGRRICIGQRLAEGRLFLFVTFLLRYFRFEPVDKNNLPEVDPRSYDLGIVLHPKPFQIRAFSRR